MTRRRLMCAARRGDRRRFGCHICLPRKFRLGLTLRIVLDTPASCRTMIPGGSRDQRRLSQEVNSVHSAVYYLSHQKAELHRKNLAIYGVGFLIPRALPWADMFCPFGAADVAVRLFSPAGLRGSGILETMRSLAFGEKCGRDAHLACVAGELGINLLHSARPENRNENSTIEKTTYENQSQEEGSVVRRWQTASGRCTSITRTLSC